MNYDDVTFEKVKMGIIKKNHEKYQKISQSI